MYDDLVSFNVSGNIITIQVQGGKMRLQPKTPEDFDEWTAAWVTVLTSAKPELLMGDTGAPEGTKQPAKPAATKPAKPISKDDEDEENMEGSLEC